MRRLASSRPRRCGMETIRGLDNQISASARLHMGMLRNRASRTREGTAARSLSMFPATLRLSARRRSRSARAGTASTGGSGLLAGRIAGGSGMTGLAALALHLMPGRIAGGAGLAGHRAMLLHPLTRCVPLGGALSMADRGGRDQQTRGRGNGESFAHHEGGLLRFAFHCGSCAAVLSPRPSNARARLRVPSACAEQLKNASCNEPYCEAAWTVHNSV